MRLWATAIVIASGCAASGCRRAAAGARDPIEAGAAVRVAGVVPARTVEQPTLYRASGTVRGRNSAVITSKLTANVRAVRVRAGDHVERGQTLALLDDDAAQANVQRSRALQREAADARVEAEHALSAAVAEERVADATYRRARNLLRERALTRQEFDETEARQRRADAAREMARARLGRAEARIGQARAETGAARAGLADARLVAPFAGRVVERHIDPGSLAAPGTPMLVIDQDGPLRVDAVVEESQAQHIRVGAAAQVELEGLERPVDAVVSEVVPAIDPVAHAFIVKAELPGGLGIEPRSGMFARVSFRVGTGRSLRIAATAVQPMGAVDRVFVVEEGRARLRLVTLGERTRDEVEVLSGLSDGDSVIAAPPPGLRDGQPVDVTP